MASIILLFLCLILGFWLKRARLFPANGHEALNAFIVNISLTALALYYLPQIKLSASVIFPVAVAWISIAAAFLLFSFLAPRLGWTSSILGAIVLTAGFANTSFVGIPVIQALYGEEGIKTVMLVDQPGSFIALSTVGLYLVNFYSGGSSGAREIFTKIMRFPPFWGFIIGLVMNIFNFSHHLVSADVLKTLGATTVPLALFSVGSQLTFSEPRKYLQPLLWGLSFKLILIPALIFVLYRFIFGQNGTEIEISILESAMPPMIMASILAASHGLEPRLCNLMVGLGIPLSFLTMGGWYLLLKFI